MTREYTMLDKDEIYNYITEKLNEELKKDHPFGLAPEQKEMKKLTCPLCGYSFKPTKEGKEVVESPSKISLIQGSIEGKMFMDAWNCPECGTQVLGCERRSVIKDEHGAV